MERNYTLNETEARIWELVDGKPSLAEIHRQMVDKFEIEPIELFKNGQCHHPGVHPDFSAARVQP